MSTNMSQKDKVQWRRNKVQELLVKGYNQYEIASTLQISRPTITMDIQHLSQCAKQNIKKYIDERLPEEYEKCLVGLTAILIEAWNTAQTSDDKREKIQALSLVKECYSMKLDLLTNATVVEDAIKFASSNKAKSKIKQSSNTDDKDTKEPHYNQYKKSDKVGEEKQEVESDEMKTTINLIF
jgi:hypothetical protein